MAAKGKTPKGRSSRNSSVPDTLKTEVETKASDLIESVLKPKHIRPPQERGRVNYVIDIGTKWHGHFLYFYSTYACPSPNAISPTFESKFARLEYVGGIEFALSFMRHTGEWVGIYDRLSVDECMKAIQDDPWFVP
ncbi:MAG: DUF3024 domain-containing protein [Thermoguttaceae bacterium]